MPKAYGPVKITRYDKEGNAIQVKEFNPTPKERIEDIDDLVDHLVDFRLSINNSVERVFKEKKKEKPVKFIKNHTVEYLYQQILLQKGYCKHTQPETLPPTLIDSKVVYRKCETCGLLIFDRYEEEEN